MRYPTATAAAAAEPCKNERRERQAGFSSTAMVLPPTSRSRTANWLETNYHDPRLGNFLFAFIFLLGSICMGAAPFALLQGREGEEKGNDSLGFARRSGLRSLCSSDYKKFWAWPSGTPANFTCG